MKKAIIGLGNPGKRYERTRHNVGFHVVETFAEEHGCLFKKKSAFHASVAEGMIDSNAVLLVKPETYMNLSGNAVGAIVNYFSLEAEDVLVIVDDVHLPFGNVRLRKKGTSGGHNGLRSIEGALGTDTYHRLRIGVSNPPAYMDMEAYVLSRFMADELDKLETVFQHASSIATDWVNKGIMYCMNRYNRDEID